MSGRTSERLKSKQEVVMSEWEKRALSEIPAAAAVGRLVLRNSLPIYLEHLSDALAKDRKWDRKSVAIHDLESERIGTLHGADRAGCAAYPLKEVISEYSLLREVIFDVLEAEEQLPRLERDIIFGSIEQAVNDAVIKFTDVHSDIRHQFVRTLTHDLRTPITSARINAQTVSTRSDSPSVCKKAARMIVASMDRLNSMIQDLLDASLLRAGEELKFQFVDCDLDSIVRDVLGEMTTVHGDRFTVDSTGPLYGHWAGDGLRRSVENLVGNAVKYGAPNTAITVMLRRSDATVEIETHNHGNPISKEDLSVLTESFELAAPTGNWANPGWGVGLTLIKGVVAAHQGSVRVMSESGLGTRFMISLPYVAMEAQAPTSTPMI